MPIEIRKGMVLPPIYPIAYPQEDTLSIRLRVVTSVKERVVKQTGSGKADVRKNVADEQQLPDIEDSHQQGEQYAEQHKKS